METLPRLLILFSDFLEFGASSLTSVVSMTFCPRQRGSHYTRSFVHVALCDKKFCYLRTVRVTTAVYRGFHSMIQSLSMHSSTAHFRAAGPAAMRRPCPKHHGRPPPRPFVEQQGGPPRASARSITAGRRCTEQPGWPPPRPCPERAGATALLPGASRLISAAALPGAVGPAAAAPLPGAADVPTFFTACTNGTTS